MDPVAVMDPAAVIDLVRWSPWVQVAGSGRR
jgi:hypothetical protein